MLYALIIAGLFIVYLVYTLWSRDQMIRLMREDVNTLSDKAVVALERAEARHNSFLDGMYLRAEKERQLLINRIQDPQFAVGQAAAMGMQIPQAGKPYVTADDDQDYWRGQREMAGE